MKKETHPQWHPEATITCSCGQVFTTGSTVASIRVSICHRCHPIYTGQEKLIDTEGLVEKYQKRQAAFQKMKSQRVVKKQEKESQQREEYRPRTLKEMLHHAQKQAKP